MATVEPAIAPEPTVGAPAGGALARRFAEVRHLTERLAAPLSAEDQTVQSMPDVSPTKWHRAHTTWFFETFLLQPSGLTPGLRSYRPFHPAFGYLFNSYYETVGARHPRPERGHLSRPGIEEVAAYRRHVDNAMVELIGGPLPAPAPDLIELGVNHEQQHQELLLIDIKHVLSRNPLRPAYLDGGRSAPRGRERPTGWSEHQGGLVEIGDAGHGFAFDNERPRHAVLLTPFALADRPVSCGDWLAFMADDGYRRPDLWLSDGWATVLAEGWRAPSYWEDSGDTWSVFTLSGTRPIDPAEPVCHVSYYEADAYARWADARLPTEAEWEVAAVARWSPVDRFDFGVLHPRPDDGGPGQVWEWTATAYLPYPGFRPAPGAVGEYNGKFMVNQHVLRGGCCVTPPDHGRPTYRNFFPPSARWPFTGLRLARDL